MNRNKRIIDCTPNEIFNLGKQLIDYYFEKSNQLTNLPYYEQPRVFCTNNTNSTYKPQFKEGEIICQDQKEL